MMIATESKKLLWERFVKLIITAIAVNTTHSRDFDAFLKTAKVPFDLLEKLTAPHPGFPECHFDSPFDKDDRPIPLSIDDRIEIITRHFEPCDRVCQLVLLLTMLKKYTPEEHAIVAGFFATLDAAIKVNRLGKKSIIRPNRKLFPFLCKSHLTIWFSRSSYIKMYGGDPKFKVLHDIIFGPQIRLAALKHRHPKHVSFVIGASLPRLFDFEYADKWAPESIFKENDRIDSELSMCIKDFFTPCGALKQLLTLDTLLKRCNNKEKPAFNTLVTSFDDGFVKLRPQYRRMITVADFFKKVRISIYLKWTTYFGVYSEKGRVEYPNLHALLFAEVIGHFSLSHRNADGVYFTLRRDPTWLLYNTISALRPSRLSNLELDLM